MEVENIFRRIPDFRSIVLDKILFESKYPVMFTCKNNKDVYLFICCLTTANKVEWIGTKTTYDNLIRLLENKITIRDAFLNITEDKIIIDYNGKNVEYRIEKRSNIPDNLLPTADEYMDAEDDEYAEEIAAFRKRNTNIEYVIKPRVNKYFVFQYRGKSVLISDDAFPINLDAKDVMQYKMEKIHNKGMAFV